MKPIEVITARFRKLPGSRDFWFSMALFSWAGFTAFILIDGFATATGWRVIRWVVQMVLLLIWGADRYRKYKSKTNTPPST